MRIHGLMTGLAGAAALLGVVGFDAHAQSSLEPPRLYAADQAQPTPMDQGNSEADLRTTQAIRKEIVANETLSMNAHNVKIITVDGVVTLRGPVKNETEKNEVVATAQRAPGVKRVNDQLEIEGAPKNPAPREPQGVNR